MEPQKYAVLISHPVYGSTYLNPSGELTKNRSEAKKFDSISSADKEAKKSEEKLKCNCDWCII